MEPSSGFEGSERPWERPPQRPGGPPRGRPGPAPRGRPDRPWERDRRPTERPPYRGAGVDGTPVEPLGEGEELVAGRRPVEEAFVAGRAAHRLLVVPQRRHALEQLVLHATRLRIPIVEVEGGSLTAVAGFDGHQGIALVVGPRRLATLDDVLARALERGEPPFVLVLDSLEDPQNLGTLLRSAEAAGVHGVLFPTRRQAPLTPSAIKASAGAVEHLLLCPVDDLAGSLADLHARGLRVAGAEEDAPMTARQTDLRGPLALVVGSEGQGLGPAVRRRCDTLMRIPMRGAVGSLNAAVAGSILLFEAVAQRDPEGAGAPPRSSPEDGRSFVAAPQERREAATAVLETVAADTAEDALPVDEAGARTDEVEATSDDAASSVPAEAAPDPDENSADAAPDPDEISAGASVDAPAVDARAGDAPAADATAPLDPGSAAPEGQAPPKPRRTRTPKVAAAAEETPAADPVTPPVKPRRTRAAKAAEALSDPVARVGDAPAEPDADDLLPGGPSPDAGDPPERPVRRRGTARA